MLGAVDPFNCVNIFMTMKHLSRQIKGCYKNKNKKSNQTLRWLLDKKYLLGRRLSFSQIVVLMSTITNCEKDSLLGRHTAKPRQIAACDISTLKVRFRTN